jgi:glutamine amidotransferase
MHNGQVGGWPIVRRKLENLIADRLYPFREGSTDSEVIFYLLLTNGVEENVDAAFALTCRQVEGAMAAHGIEEPFRLAACLTDGERMFALRHSSDHASPTLFHASGGGISVDQGCCRFESSRGDVLVLSEPLDAIEAAWQEVPEGFMLSASGGRVELHAFDTSLG